MGHFGALVKIQKPDIQCLKCEMPHFSFSTLPAGIYFVKINGAEVKKFVKE